MAQVAYDQENFKEAKYGADIIPFFNDEDVMNDYVLTPFTTKSFPDGGYQIADEATS